MHAADRTLIFVYGTLKRGGSNHAQLAGQIYLGPASTAPGYTLYSLGEYPGLVADPADRSGVNGELWAVDAATLARLDAFEGVDEGLYARVPAPLSTWPENLPATEAARAWMYLYLRDLSDRPHIGPEWPT
jgi:gamma-glutamylcyclotransferase (GGCT)/AIG2-like uncharacterized protein YtfP